MKFLYNLRIQIYIGTIIVKEVSKLNSYKQTVY